MSNGQYPPPPPPPTVVVQKQSMPGWAKGLIACGCLVLVIGAVILGFTVWAGKKAYDTVSDPAKMAEMIISANSDLEVVENNKEAGTITVRDKTTGDVTTFNYADLQQGKFSIEGKDGKTVTVDGSDLSQGGNLQVTGPDGEKIDIATDASGTPSWVPLYPNAKTTSGGKAISIGGKGAGSTTQTTADSLAVVKKYYEDFFAREGYKVQGNIPGSVVGQDGFLLSGEKDGRNLTVAGGPSGTDSVVNLTYIQ